MPPRKSATPQRRVARCSYREGKRRCPYDGGGVPILCRAHRIAVAEAARPKNPIEVILGSLGDLIAGRETDTDAAINAAAVAFDQWWAARNGAGAPPGRHDAPRWWTEGRPWDAGQPRGGQRQPPQGAPPDVEAELHRAARRVMGFSGKDRLTVESVKDRRRVLAKKHHPDRGGSVATMARINDAADVLLASL